MTGSVAEAGWKTTPRPAITRFPESLFANRGDSVPEAAEKVNPNKPLKPCSIFCYQPNWLRSQTMS